MLQSQSKRNFFSDIEKDKRWEAKQRAGERNEKVSKNLAKLKKTLKENRGKR